MTSLHAESLFAGRYRVVRCIAAGGMGAVYEVVHVETERRRALKVMHAHFVQSAELRERFKLEAKVAGQIDSEFVVDVFDAGVDEATQMPFLVMELLKGEELGKQLARVGRFSAPETITYLWQTALALDKTHKAGIVHRDLKPENLFLTQREDGPPRIKVLDFGVAKFIAETGTQGGATRSLGTPLYMAPEQFRGQKVSAASDNFALAMMSFTLLVGQPYWAPEADADVDIVAFALQAHVGPIELGSVRALAAGVRLPERFDAWFARATASDPQTRFQTATACIAALGEVFGLQPAQLTGFGSSDPLLPALARRASSPAFGGTHAMVDTGSATASTAVPGITRGAARSRGTPWTLIGAGVLAAAIGGAYLVHARRPVSASAPAAAPDDRPASGASTQAAVVVSLSASAASQPQPEPLTSAGVSEATAPTATPALSNAAPNAPAKLRPARATSVAPGSAQAPASQPARTPPTAPTYSRD